MMNKLTTLSKSSATINTRLFTCGYSFMKSDTIVNRIMDGLQNTSIMQLYAFSDIQISALRYAFATIVSKVREPLISELALKHGTPSSKKTVGYIQADILNDNVSFRILNSFSTFGSDTSLELQVPINLIYKLYAQFLWDHFEVSNDRLGHQSINPHLMKPTKPQMQLYIKSLSQSDLLIQDCSSQINEQLLFSITSTFIHPYLTEIEEYETDEYDE